MTSHDASRKSRRGCGAKRRARCASRRFATTAVRLPAWFPMVMGPSSCSNRCRRGAIKRGCNRCCSARAWSWRSRCWCAWLDSSVDAGGVLRECSDRCVNVAPVAGRRGDGFAIRRDGPDDIDDVFRRVLLDHLVRRPLVGALGAIDGTASGAGFDRGGGSGGAQLALARSDRAAIDRPRPVLAGACLAWAYVAIVFHFLALRLSY